MTGSERHILVVNAGSSSIKFEIFAIAGSGLERRVRGQLEGIGVEPRLRAEGLDGAIHVDQRFDAATVADVPGAFHKAAVWLTGAGHWHFVAVGHRVVHGGPDHAAPIRLNLDEVRKLERYIPLAPLHQPNNLAPIAHLLERHPELPQVACFDTAFHRGHDPLADYYAIPTALHDEGVRRYGFHGLSYEFIAGRLRELAPALAGGRVIVAHLGNGASMCAMRDGRSVDSTMGFTALEGLPMGTRPGQIDPGVLLYLMAEKGMDDRALEHFLYHDCGLAGLSGIGSDMRTLQTSDDPRAAFAIDYFAQRIGLHTGMLAAALGGVDGFVFTAGIGENSATIRAKVVARLGWLGAELAPAANAQDATFISTAASRLALLVVPTDEELMIARHTFELVFGHGSA